MSDKYVDDVYKLKKELRECKRKLKDQTAFNESLRSFIGYEELKGWQPNQQIEKQYGWVYAWLYPLRVYIASNIVPPLPQDFPRKIEEIVTAIIAQLVVLGRYGVKLPYDPRPYDTEMFFAKQNSSLYNVYKQCEICGEDRITHFCHIIPRVEGGPDHKDNYLWLCPLHHHLFDNARLTKNEWEAVEKAIIGKMDAAIIYSHEVRLPMLQSWWIRQERKLSNALQD